MESTPDGKEEDVSPMEAISVSGNLPPYSSPLLLEDSSMETTATPVVLPLVEQNPPSALDTTPPVTTLMSGEASQSIDSNDSDMMVDIPVPLISNQENSGITSLVKEPMANKQLGTPMDVSIPPIETAPVVPPKEVESVKSPESVDNVIKPMQTRRKNVSPIDPIDSLAGSLTPMSERLEQTSPVELLETSDGSVRIKGDLDPSPTPFSYRSRSSSQSSKSSKGGSPKSQRSPAPPKSKKKRPPPPKEERGEHDKNDFYCWICHKEGEVLCCELCPRVFHAKCLHITSAPEGDWYCPECEKVMVAECKETQSRAMSQLSIDQLALHLRYALQRMKTTGCEPFLEPVNTKEFTDYLDYVFHPMDLSTLEKNIKKRTYGCTEAFLADVKWIVHNCVLYNGVNTKLTHIAKTIVKIAQHEMSEIEVCPECYLNSCRKRENWFCEPCKDIHVLVWAKLQGFPHWPAKVLRIEKGQVDARFFGQHDRAWIPLSGCYLMSKEMPHPVTKKKGRGPGAKGGLDNAMQEMQGYIDNVIRKTGNFEYAPPRTALTHLDLCRKSTAGLKEDGNLNLNQDPQQTTAPVTSISVKKEMMQEEKEKQSGTAAKSSLGIDVSLSTSAPQKKKSKVVTTSGAHPQKGSRTYAPKKKASMEFLEKTIESCKASLRDTVESMSDDSTSDSESSFDSEGESAATDKSTPDKGVKPGEAAKVDEKTSKRVEKNLKSDDSDTNLVIDLPESESNPKKDTSVSALVEKGFAKVKKRTEGDAAKKLSTKTKSILLNKETGSPKRSTPGSLSRPSGNADTGIKRKLLDETLPSGKVRKIDASGSTKSTNPSTQKLGKPLIPIKDKKKHTGDEDKSKKANDPYAFKSKKDGIPPSLSAPIPKKATSEVTIKKKAPSSTTIKGRTDDAQDKSDLKSAAKLLAKKVMTRKQVPGQEKPKSIIQTGVKPTESNAKKLSSFTIPKHKPSTVRPEADPPSSGIMSNKGGNQASVHNASAASDRNRQNKIPSVNVPMQKLKKYNDKVMQNMQQVLVEMYEDMLAMFESTTQQTPPPSSHGMSIDSNAGQQVSKLRLELEHLKWMHQQEVAELQHNHDLTIAEIRQSLENEKVHLLDVAKHKSDAEKAKAVEEAKKKQWCANCGREAIFYCCWNTSYCDYPCQQLHWPKHMATCSQARDRAATTAPSGSTSQVVNMTSKTKKEAPKKVESLPSPKPASVPEPEVKSVSIDDDKDDDHSDNDMMVIDETAHKEADTLAADTPQSPEDEFDFKFGKKKSSSSPPSHAEDILSKVSEVAPMNSEPVEKPKEAIVSLSSSPLQPLAGAVVSALTKDTKGSSFPLKSVLSPVTGATPAKVVPSKLIDDIFSKVHEKDTVSTSENVTASAITTPSISSSKGLLKSVTDPARTGKPVDQVSAKSPRSASMSPTRSWGLDIQDTKSRSSGGVISAIGDRLLKARSLTPSGESVTSDKQQPASSGEEATRESSAASLEVMEAELSMATADDENRPVVTDGSGKSDNTTNVDEVKLRDVSPKINVTNANHQSNQNLPISSKEPSSDVSKVAVSTSSNPAHESITVTSSVAHTSSFSSMMQDVLQEKGGKDSIAMIAYEGTSVQEDTSSITNQSSDGVVIDHDVIPMISETADLIAPDPSVISTDATFKGRSDSKESSYVIATSPDVASSHMQAEPSDSNAASPMDTDVAMSGLPHQSFSSRPGGQAETASDHETGMDVSDLATPQSPELT